MGEVSPALFLPKEFPDHVCLWFKFSFKNSALENLGESWRKNTKNSPYVSVLLYAVHEMFMEVPIFRETSSALKDSWFGIETDKLLHTPKIITFLPHSPFIELLGHASNPISLLYPYLSGLPS